MTDLARDRPPLLGPDVLYARAGGPRIRLNQAGYLPHGPRRATLVVPPGEAAPRPFQVVDAAGSVVASGLTEPWPGIDATSGLAVHVLDLAAVPVGGPWTVRCGDDVSHPFAVSGEAYRRLRRDSKALYYAMRSGIEIRDDVLPGYGRPAGHIGVAPNRGDTAVRAWTGPTAEALYPGWRFDGEVDVSGGWYDAGDHGKYVVNAGLTVCQLLAEYERSQRVPTAEPGALGDGSLAVPEHGNGVPDLLDEVRWELEWLLRMQVPAPDPLAGMAFHKVHDDAWTALPLRAEADPRPRVLHRPSTAATYNLAAAAAQGARVFAPFDAAFAARLLDAARLAYATAVRLPVLLAPHESTSDGGGPYGDDDVSDDRYWAAAQLFLTTGEERYREDVAASPWHARDPFDAGGYDWDAVAAPARLDLATVVPPGGAVVPGLDGVRESVVAAASRFADLAAAQPWGQPYAPDGGRWVWGSNGRLLNNVVVLVTAFDLTGEQRFADAALGGIDYLFGRNALGRCYVAGYGTEPVRDFHARMFAPSLDPSLPPAPAGTLSGGANSCVAGFAEEERFAGLPSQWCHVDETGSYTTNELAINWNAALSRVSSFLADEGAHGH